MTDHPMTPPSDAESTTSFDLAPDSPLSKEKSRAAHATWLRELHQRAEYRLVASLSHPSLTTEAALHQLVDLTHAAAQEDAIGNHCWTTACSVLEVAARTAPEQQGALLGFLLELGAVEITDPETGAPWMFEDGAGVVWRDLPTFGYTVADEMGSFDGHEQAYTGEEAAKWENLTAFLAQVDARVQESGSVLDYSQSCALTAFAWAFEGGGEMGAPSELAVRLACIWVVYDVEKLWFKVQDSEAEANTLERWNAWRQGLVESQSRFVDGTTPMLTTHALDQMQRVQEGK